MTLLQLAGEALDTFILSLPAAITTTEPRDTALLIAFWKVLPHEPLPPRLRLMTLAGVALAGTPLTLPPDDQTMASAMSES